MPTIETPEGRPGWEPLARYTDMDGDALTVERTRLGPDSRCVTFATPPMGATLDPDQMRDLIARLQAELAR